MATLTKDKMISLMRMGAYLAQNSDFAKYMVEQAEKRYNEDKYDCDFLNMREVITDLAKIVKHSNASNFPIKKTYFLCKHLERILSKWQKEIKDYNLIPDPAFNSDFKRIVDGFNNPESKYIDLLLNK